MSRSAAMLHFFALARTKTTASKSEGYYLLTPYATISPSKKDQKGSCLRLGNRSWFFELINIRWALT